MALSRDEILEKLKQVIEEVLIKAPEVVTEESRFKEDLDADSLDLVEAIMGVEEAFDISITEEDLEDVKTVGQLIDLIQRKLAEKGDAAA